MIGLVTTAVAALSADTAGARATLRARHTHVLVDEFQDATLYS